MPKTDVPLPVGGAGTLDVTIPLDLLKEYKVEPRFIIRYPWLIGVPIPELIRKDLVEKFAAAGFEVMLVPKQAMH
jgi:hypothetical protein